MKSWFYSLQSREQMMVLAAAMFVVFALVYFAIWMPLDRGQSSLSSSVTTWQRSLAELKPLKTAVRNAGSRNAVRAGAGQSLVVIVDTTLRARNLDSVLQRSQPTGANGIRVEFKDAPFDDLIRWLGDLNHRYALQVQAGNFSVSTQNIPGRVNASLTLER